MEFKNYVVLQEMLDNIPSNMDIRWSPPLSRQNYGQQYTAYFVVSEKEYYIQFQKAAQFPTKQRNKQGLFDYYVVWDIQKDGFDPEDHHHPDEKEGKKFFKRTHLADKNIGNAIEVLKHVLAAIREFLTTMNPAMISYRPADEQLSRSYKMFAHKHADRMGYEFRGRHLVRKDVISKWGSTIDQFLSNTNGVV